MKIAQWLSSVKSLLIKIKLVDRCLIVFMVILMAQSAYNLFVNEKVVQESNMVDVVVRTTSAAIFGYFLSANFIKNPTKKSGEHTEPLTATACDTPPCDGENITLKNQIGFAAQPKNLEVQAAQSAQPPPKEPPEGETSHQQIIIATSIGVFALLVLLLARNFMVITPVMVGTLSQMRDFVSGCVGFLLGSPGVDNHEA